MPTAVTTEFDRKDDVEHRDLNDSGEQRRMDMGANVVFRLRHVVDFARALGEQEDAACSENEITPRKIDAPDRDDGRLERDDEGDARQKRDPQSQRQDQADAPRHRALLGHHFVGDQRQENDVVDAKDDLQDRQREQRDPGIDGEEEGVHRQIEAQNQAGAR